MLFHSWEFLLVFLPLTLCGALLLAKVSQRLALGWLAAASLLFYSAWRPAYLPILLASVVLNFLVGVRLARRPSAAWLAGGIAANLGLLGFFKYGGFLTDNVNLALGTGFSFPDLLLPLGISFFTFQQIAYLVDVQQGATRERRFIDYCVFVTFFPQLIAGPIVHHSVLLPQLKGRRALVFDLEDLAVGLTALVIGLFKKIVVADSLAPYANRVFDAAAAGAEPALLDSWMGATAFTLQLYFDFSGYSDMAIGLGRMFGVRLPINFNSPFKAASIIEFWERWHITLTRFLTAYVYNPILMRLTRRWMRSGRPMPRRSSFTAASFAVLVATPTLVTMGLAGIWHGAGYQFIVFGLLHGVYLTANHAWRVLRLRLGLRSRGDAAARRAGMLATFAAVVLSLVFFRSESLVQAQAIVLGMIGANGIVLPAGLVDLLPLAGLGFLAAPDPAAATLLPDRFALVLAALLLAVWSLPNTQEWLAPFAVDPELRPTAAAMPAAVSGGLRAWRHWRPNVACGAGIGAALYMVVVQLASDAPKEFLYFNF